MNLVLVLLVYCADDRDNDSGLTLGRGGRVSKRLNHEREFRVRAVLPCAKREQEPWAGGFPSEAR